MPDVVLDGMFMINTSPLTTHTTMKDYSQFLLCRFVLHHLTNGCNKVHVVFDNPVDSLIPLSHLNVDVGMTQPHSPLIISM